MSSAHMLVTLVFSYHIIATLSAVLHAWTYSNSVPLKITVIVCIYNIHLDYAETSNAIYSLLCCILCLNEYVSICCVAIRRKSLLQTLGEYERKRTRHCAHISTIEEIARCHVNADEFGTRARKTFLFLVIFVPPWEITAVALTTAKSRGRARIALLRFVLNA